MNALQQVKARHVSSSIKECQDNLSHFRYIIQIPLDTCKENKSLVHLTRYFSMGTLVMFILPDLMCTI